MTMKMLKKHWQMMVAFFTLSALFVGFQNFGNGEFDLGNICPEQMEMVEAEFSNGTVVIQCRSRGAQSLPTVTVTASWPQAPQGPIQPPTWLDLESRPSQGGRYVPPVDPNAPPGCDPRADECEGEPNVGCLPCLAVIPALVAAAPRIQLLMFRYLGLAVEYGDEFLTFLTRNSDKVSFLIRQVNSLPLGSQLNTQFLTISRSLSNQYSMVLKLPGGNETFDHNTVVGLRNLLVNAGF
jgi:hypothetical protein